MIVASANIAVEELPSTVNQVDIKGSKQLLYANWSVQDALLGN